MPSTEISLIPLYRKQKQAFYNDARIAVCEASTKAGKSVGGLTWSLERGINQYPGRDILWCAPIYPQAKIMYRRACRWLTRMNIAELWSKNDSELFIILPRNPKDGPGGHWWFKGADNPDSIYGPDYALAVMDEFTRAKEEAFFAVESTLTATGGPLRLIGNVKGRGNWGYRIARRAQTGEPGMHYSKITAYDAVAAGVLDPAVIESKKRTLPEHIFRELFLAEPSDDGGNPFGVQHIAACIDVDWHPVSDGRRVATPQGYTPHEGTPVAFGVDLARKQDWLVVIGLDDTGRVVTFDRWRGVPWEDSYRRIAALIGDSPTYVDSTGLGDVVLDRLQRMCPNVEGYLFTPLGKQKLMEGLSVAIQSHRIRFPDNEIRKELDTFEFEVKPTYTRYAAPEGCSDDCVCALALAVEMLGTQVPVEATLVNGKQPDIDAGKARELWELRRRREASDWDRGL